MANEAEVKTIPIAIFANDLTTWEGAVALLSAHPDIVVLTPDYQRYASILLVITTSVTDSMLSGMEYAQATSVRRRLRVVLVADDISPRLLLRAVNAGLVRLLDRRRCGYDRIAGAIQAAIAGPAAYVPATVSHLPDHGWPGCGGRSPAHRPQSVVPSNGRQGP